jgi:flagellar motility protein MotE (MotC chaperone)
MWKIPAPRLLPATIATLAALLMVKCGILLDAVVLHGGKTDSVMVTAANAASTERSPEGASAPAPDRGKPTAPTPTPAEPKPVASAPPNEGPPPVSDSERALLQDLRERRKELEARAAAVTARESLMAATEEKLNTRVGELQALQKQLEGLNAAQKQKEESGWQGLVKVYEAMKPKDAATIFNDLQMPVLLQVLDRMKDAKAAAVMAAMSPDKAREVTTQLAQMRTGKDAAQMGAAAGSRTSPAGG